MLSFFYRVEKLSVSLFTQTAPSHPCRLFSRLRGKLLLVWLLLFFPAAGKDAEIVGRHNWDFPQLDSRSVNHAAGPLPLVEGRQCVCRSAHARRLSRIRRSVSRQGSHFSGNPTRRPRRPPQAPPPSNLRFFCVSKCHAVLLEFTLAHRKQPNIESVKRVYSV